jgi:hypothetical protein
MPSESGDQKIIGNLRKLIDFVAADPNYNPASAKITVAGLETLYTLSQGVAMNVRTTEAPYKVSVNTRQTLFADVAPRMGSAFRMAKASGASQPILDDLNTSRRKLSSQPRAKVANDDPNAPAKEDGTSNTTHSTSQMSYDNQVGNAASMVALLGHIPTYNPNEEKLKVASLQAFITELQAANDAVNTNFVPFSQARSTRDEVLYTGDDSVASIARLVKAYVSAALGTQSPLYKSIKGLKFERKRRV